MIRNPEPKTQPCLPRAILRVVLPLIILAAAIAVAAHIMTTKPEAKKRPRTSQPPLVRWEVTRMSDHPVIVTAMGTVLPSTQIELKARVGGQVEWLSENLVPGGRFAKGEVLLKLDKADLELALATARGKLKQARADLALEQGNQDVARKELALMETTSGRTIEDRTLALRQPQLAKAEAGLALAEADQKKALLDLARSEIKAPFDGIVISRSAPTGTLVSAGQTVATLTADDTWWVEATLPVKDLPRLLLPGPNAPQGSRVQIHTRNETTFQGHLIQILGDLNDKSRMARLLIEVKDPMGQAEAMNTPPLLLNSYVTAELEGKPLEGVIALPDRALRDGSEVWVAEGNTLRRKPVRIAWRQGPTVFVGQGLSPGERVITSDLSSPADGMKIRTGEEINEREGKAGMDNEQGKSKPAAGRG